MNTNPIDLLRSRVRTFARVPLESCRYGYPPPVSGAPAQALAALTAAAEEHLEIEAEKLSIDRDLAGDGFTPSIARALTARVRDLATREAESLRSVLAHKDALTTAAVAVAEAAAAARGKAVARLSEQITKLAGPPPTEDWVATVFRRFAVFEQERIAGAAIGEVVQACVTLADRLEALDAWRMENAPL